MLHAERLTCIVDDRPLFAALTLSLAAGELLQVAGDNGAGKTSLLRILCGLARPESGVVSWQGQPLAKVRESFHRQLLLLVIGLGWGFGFAPADYQQGESYRIMYLHVPAAMWSMGLYLAMALAAFVGVVWQIKMADLAIAALAPVGAVCTLVALVSGAAWGKPMWGTWWIWDARLTSELVLLFLYAGVIALWHAFDDRRLAGRAAGILVLVGVVNLPIIHYSVYWWNTLHQGSTNLQQTIDPSMRLPLRICIFAFLTLSVTLTLMRLRNLILQLERRRPWVVALVNKGAAR
ncbi:heme ABC transporter permease CcmC [Klebsiella pneumoniae]|nr:heme ABC transporter permease CcmC [Klebsiella pneumoniae]MCX0259419.1 heme ABC transporter permease CcmC [Klebsiella pneumoniae]